MLYLKHVVVRSAIRGADIAGLSLGLSERLITRFLTVLCASDRFVVYSSFYKAEYILFHQLFFELFFLGKAAVP